MSGGMTTTRIKTDKPVTQSQLLSALRESMGPIFSHFEEELMKSDGKILDIRISAKGFNVKIEYGIGEVEE